MRRMIFVSQSLLKLSCVDFDWTCILTKAIHSTGIQHIIPEFLSQYFMLMPIVCLFKSFQFTAGNNSSTRRGGDVATRTYVLTITAFNTFVDFFFYCGQFLQ